ncbi:ABC transporter substrate-binding protein [Cohnella sp. GCM10020058]|uniref:ABC transporter substrate-binding protein n=1 Tax=Cohnella sp. GCM10020058 TaxID=3317330 RepID=UPI00362A88C2
MKRKSWLPVSLALILILTLLSACGGNNNGNNASPSSSASASPSASEPAASPSASASSSESAAPSALSGKLVIWTFFDQVNDMAAKFMEKNPGVQVEVKMFPGDQYQTKLLTALQSGKDLPDIFDLERGYIGKFIDSKFLADLSALGAEDLVKDYVPYVQGLGRSSDGKLKAISDHSSPGGFWYLKETAKKYLGTDDAAEIGAMVSDWDKLIETGKKVYDQSGGKVHLIESANDLFDIMAYNTDAWVKDGALNIDPKWKDTYAVQQKIRESNVDAKLDFMSAGWGTALNSGTVVLTSMPAWAGFMIDNKDDKAVGKFGVAPAPLGFYTGGTYRGIYDKSPNKELAYEFIKYIASSEWQTYNLGKTGNMPGLATVYQDNMDSFKSTFFGDQNILKPYYDTVAKMPALSADKYGEEILSLWRKTAGQGITNKTDYDKVVASFKKEVKNAFPDLKVD